MATKAQIRANRKNARKSTGPKTDEGKAKVSQNAVTHGLRAQRDVIIGEDPAEFYAHRDRILGELAPVGAMETMMAERIMHLSWRLKRAQRIQNEVFDALHAKIISGPVARLVEAFAPKGPDGEGTFGPDGEDYALGRIVLRDFSNQRVLDHLLMYERRIESSLFRTMAELRKLRLMRELDLPGEQQTSSPAGHEHPAMSCRAERSGVETSRYGHGAPATGSEISPLRASASGRNDQSREVLAIGRGDASPGSGGGNDAKRQTKPMGGPDPSAALGVTDKAVCGAHPTPSASHPNDAGPGEDRAKQTQFGEPVGREPRTDRAKQSQCAVPRLLRRYASRNDRAARRGDRAKQSQCREAK